MRVIRPDVRVFADGAALADAAAALFAETVDRAVAARGRAFVSLAGGGTPRATYARLAERWRDGLPWERTTLVLGDERPVPEGDAQSNARMVEEALVSRLPAGSVRLVRWETGARAPDEVASRMEEALREAFSSKPGEVPRFDLVLLGLGADGHTASLFPRSPALVERRRLAVANSAPPPAGLRYTLTYPVLEAARRAAFLVCGAGKAEAVGRVLGEGEGSGLPAARPMALDGETVWLLDAGAASRLPA